MVEHVARDDGALAPPACCEVLSCVMRGAPRTADALTLLDPSGSRVRVTLADVAALQLKALYKRHPAFDDQQCWLAASTSHAAHCVADGDGLAAFAHHPAAFTIRARNWLHGDVRKGGDTFELRLRGEREVAAGAVVDNGDGSYSATYTATVDDVRAPRHARPKAHPRSAAAALAAPRNSARVSDAIRVTQARRLLSSSTPTPPCRPTAALGAGLCRPPSPASPRMRDDSEEGSNEAAADARRRPLLRRRARPRPAGARSSDERDGSYSVTYVAKAAGRYQLDVGAPMNGPIDGVAGDRRWPPGKPHAAASGPAEQPPAVVRAGAPLKVAVLLRDRHGNDAPPPPAAAAAAQSSRGRSPVRLGRCAPM